MTFPTIAATNTSSDSGTTQTVNLPSSISNGDLLIIFIATDGDNTITNWNGFNEIFSMSDSGGKDSSLHIGYKSASGSEGSTVDITTSSNEKGTHASYRITGWDSGQVPEASTGVQGVSSAPDSDSLTPTGGAKDYLWFTAYGSDDDDSTVSTWPTNYSLSQLNPTVADPGGAVLGVAGRNYNASSEDPGAFATNDSEQWVAATVAVHPSTGIQTYEKEFSADSILKKSNIEKEFITDAVLKKSDIDKEFTTDLILKATEEKEFSVDTILKKSDIKKEFLVDAFLQKKDNEKEFTSDAIITLTGEKEFSVDAVLKKSDIEKEFTIDAFLKATLEKEFTTDAFLEKTDIKDFSVDAIIVNVRTKELTTDAFLEATLEKEFTTDAIVVNKNTKEFTTDAILTLTGDKEFTTDAILKVTKEKEFTVDSILKKSDNDKILSVNALIQELDLEKEFTADAILEAGGVTYEKELTADSILKATQDKTFTSDAIIGSAVKKGWGPFEKKEKEYFLDIYMKVIKKTNFDFNIISNVQMMKIRAIKIYNKVSKNIITKVKISANINHKKLIDIIEAI